MSQMPFIPSVEHEWGLFRNSTQQQWIGLSERELHLIWDLVCSATAADWLVWNRKWDAWKPAAQFSPEFVSVLSTGIGPEEKK